MTTIDEQFELEKWNSTFFILKKKVQKKTSSECYHQDTRFRKKMMMLF